MGGQDLWAVVKGDREFGAAFNNGMACDGRFVMEEGVRREEGWWPELELRRRVPPPGRELRRAQGRWERERIEGRVRKIGYDMYILLDGS